MMCESQKEWEPGTYPLDRWDDLSRRATVSYTHLLAAQSRVEHILILVLAPVSYTHLDVYKRQ